MMKENAEIGIIGGSGFCTFPEIDLREKVDLETKYGKPSTEISIGEYAGKIIAFLPRHDYKHQLAPHTIPYRANIAAFKEIGVGVIIAFCAAGSLKDRIKPGDLVVFDQFVNLTWGRDVSFDPNEPFVHLPMANPYSEKLRKIVFDEGKKLGLRIHKNGTVVVIQGPRFNTKAESVWFSQSGWDAVNMTQYPECYFAKEEGLHYAAVAGITDYDVCLQNLGLSMTKDKIKESSFIFVDNVTKSKQLITRILQNWTQHRNDLAEINNDNAPYYQES